MKQKPCTTPNGKHKWSHLKNYTKQTISMGMRGTSIQSSVRGLYVCSQCQERRSGKATQGADLRTLPPPTQGVDVRPVLGPNT